MWYFRLTPVKLLEMRTLSILWFLRLSFDKGAYRFCIFTPKQYLPPNLCALLLSRYVTLYIWFSGKTTIALTNVYLTCCAYFDVFYEVDWRCTAKLLLTTVTVVADRKCFVDERHVVTGEDKVFRCSLFDVTHVDVDRWLFAAVTSRVSCTPSGRTWVPAKMTTMQLAWL